MKKLDFSSLKATIDSGPEPFEIRSYETPSRKSPFGDWIEALRDSRARAIIRVRIGRLRLGNFGDCKNVGDGVGELRIDFGPGYRVYFGRKGKRIILLLCGGDKRSQKKDIQRAIKYWAEFLRRENG